MSSIVSPDSFKVLAAAAAGPRQCRFARAVRFPAPAFLVHGPVPHGPSSGEALAAAVPVLRRLNAGPEYVAS